MTIKASSYPTSRPTLDLNFAQTKRLDPRVTFTRSSTGTYFDANGVLQSAATNTARFDHNPATGESLGLLVEESRINRFQYSTYFDNAWWTATNATVVPSYDVAPDGTATAEKLISGTAASSESYILSSGIFFGENVCYVSVFAKAAGYNYVGIKGGEFGRAAIFDLSNGTISYQASGSQAIIQNCGNGWYRCSVYGYHYGSTYQWRINTTSSPTSFTFTGNGSSGVLIWGAQLEVGSFPTSYIPTPATFTSRASSATYYDASGVIQTAATNVARSAAFFPDSNGTMRSAGLLLEAAGTNLLTYSEQFDNAVWTKTNLTITANATAAPDGTTTADKLVASNGSTSCEMLTPSLVPSIGTTYTFSIFAKASSPANWLMITGYDSNNNNTGRIWFNLSTGVIGTNNGKITSASIQKLSNGWYRCSASYIPTQSEIIMFVSNATGDNNLQYAGDGTNGIFVWGAQLEASPYPTSYIATTTATVTRSADVSSSATVTRSADVASITGTNFSSWYNQSQGTVFTSVRTVTPASTANGFLQFTDGTSNNRIEIRQQNSGDPYPRVGGIYRYLNNTTGSFLNQETGWNPDGKTLDNWAFAFNSSGFTLQTKFDSTPSTGTGTYPQNLTQLTLGHCGTTSRLTYWPTRLSDATLQAITL